MFSVVPVPLLVVAGSAVVFAFILHISVLTIELLRNGMYAKNISPEIMIVIGGLLIVSLLVPRVVGGVGKAAGK